MQASQAKNETRLPRAVLRRSEAIQARIDARESKTMTVDEAPPADGPSTETTPPVESKPQPVVDPRESDPAYWKQRFKVTAGVLDAERNDRKAQVVEFNQRLTELQEQVLQLQSATPATPTDLGKYFTPERVEELGEDVCREQVAAIEKAVKEQMSALIDKEIKPLKDARKAEAENELLSSKRQFYDRLAELVPDYAEVDTAETGFHDWLMQKTDDGIERQEVLTRHVQNKDVVNVARMFEKFKKTKEPVQPPVTPIGSGANTQSVQTQPVARLTAPTNAEVKEFYKKAAVGKVSQQERVDFEARMKLRTGR